MKDFQWENFINVNFLILRVMSLWKVDEIMKIFLSESRLWGEWYLDRVILMVDEEFIKIWDFINDLWEVPISGNCTKVCVDGGFKVRNIV